MGVPHLAEGAQRAVEIERHFCSMLGSIREGGADVGAVVMEGLGCYWGVWLSGNLAVVLTVLADVILSRPLLCALVYIALKMGTLTINPTQKCCNDLNIK